MLIRRHISTAALTIAIAMTLTACSDEDTSGIPTAGTPAASATPSPTPTWATDFTAEEIAEYDKALARWTEYETRSQALWANPKVTPESQELLRDYWITWPNMVNTLTYYEKNGYAVKSLATTLWSRAGAVTKTPNGYSVVIEQCVDPSTGEMVYPDDVKVEKRDAAPYIRSIDLSSSPKTGGVYKVSTLKDLSNLGEDVQSCDG